MTDYRAIAMAWVADPAHRPAVEAAARHLHANESLHLHDNVEGKEPCSYCWLRAAKAIQAIERSGQRILKPLTDEQLAEISRHDDRADPDDMTLGDIDRRKLLAEVEQLRDQVEVVRRVGEAAANRAAYEAMDTERRGWESRRAVENVTLADLRRDRDRARDIAVALVQEVAIVTRHRDYLAQRLDAVKKEAAGRKAHGDRLEAERDAAHAHVRRLIANRDAVARAVRSPSVTDAERLAEIREAFAIVDGQRTEDEQAKPVCRCGEPGRTDDDMYQCEADDCVAHDYLATGGALSLRGSGRYPHPDLTDLRNAIAEGEGRC